MGNLNLEASLAMRDTFGYPQDRFPQYVWNRSLVHDFRSGVATPRWTEWSLFHYYPKLREQPNEEYQWVAAPDDVAALMFLEEHHGYAWARSRGGDFGGWRAMALRGNPAMWEGRLITGDSPSALIVAIAEYAKQHPAPAGA